MNLLLPFHLLTRREAVWAAAADRGLAWRDLLVLTAFIGLACGIYGAILAGWRSPQLSLYVAFKLPFLFIATTAVVSVFNWMLAAMLGAGLSFRSTLFIVFAALTIAAWILLGLAPVALFFVLSGVPASGTHAELRYAHNCMLSTHILVLAVAGVAGYGVLLGGLRRLVRPHCPSRVLFMGWLALSAFVGCQMAWILRPFVGSPFFPVVFMRPDCLDRNFYEFVFGEVLPYVLTGGT